MQEYHVQGLEVSEGVELLQKLKVEGAETELRVAVEHCSGHAFALTLLASLLRKRSLSLTAFFRDPSYGQLWTGNVARNLLDSIYTQQLDELQRKLLLAFSIYREPVPLEAALALVDAAADFSRAQMQDALDGLLAQHLLQPTGDEHYQLHTVVIDYAQHHFDMGSEQANRQAVRVAHTRAAQYYQQKAVRECPPQGQRQQISHVQPLIEAVYQLDQAERWREAYVLMQQEGIFADLERWGRYATLLELYELLLPLERWPAQSSEAASIYNRLGEVYRSLAQVERARACFDHALQVCKNGGDHREEGWALNNLGRLETALEHKERGLEYYAQALAIFRGEKDLTGESEVLTNLGWVYYDLDMLQRAQEYYEQAVAICRQENDRKREAALLNSMGRVYANLGQLEQARANHEQALRIYQEISYRKGRNASEDDNGILTFQSDGGSAWLTFSVFTHNAFHDLLPLKVASHWFGSGW
jgi:tetratricopeptide (TPR) repeat protein